MLPQVVDAHLIERCRSAGAAPPRRPLIVKLQPVIRDPTPADADAIALVEVRAWQAAYQRSLGAQFLNDLSVPLRATAWATTIAATDRTTLVAEEAGSVIGVCSVTAPRAIAEVLAAYVDPLHWQAGVGRPLLESAFGRIADQPWEEVHAWLFLHNAMGRAFFARFGFRMDGTTRVHKASGAQEVRMRVKRTSVPF